MLLNRAYNPVEPRTEFRNRLLDTLKQTQRTSVSTRLRRRRRVLRLASLGSGLAAAAVLLITLTPLASFGPDAPGGTGEVAFVNAENNSGVSVWVPNEEAPATAPALAAAATTNLASTPLPVRFISPALVQQPEKKDWQAVEEDTSLKLVDGMSIRPAKDTDLGLWIEGGALLSLNDGGCIRHEDGRLRVDRGKAIIRVGEEARPLRVCVPDYDVEVVPGSDVVFDVEPTEGYAPGGAPPPYVAVLEGKANATSVHGTGTLLAGHEYDLYGTFVNGVPGRRIGTMRQQVITDQMYGHFAADTPRSAWKARPVREVEGHTFVRENGVWVDDACTDEANRVKIRYMSSEFEKLVKENDFLRRCFYRLRGPFVTRYNGTCYEISRK